MNGNCNILSKVFFSIEMIIEAASSFYVLEQMFVAIG